METATTTAPAFDILSAVRALPRDVRDIVHGFHRLNVIEDKARQQHRATMSVLECIADDARHEKPFAEFVFAQLGDADAMADYEEESQTERVRFADDFVVTMYPHTVYDVDDFDAVACAQHMIRAGLCYAIQQHVKRVC